MEGSFVKTFLNNFKIDCSRKFRNLKIDYLSSWLMHKLIKIKNTLLTNK